MNPRLLAVAVLALGVASRVQAQSKINPNLDIQSPWGPDSSAASAPPPVQAGQMTQSCDPTTTSCPRAGTASPPGPQNVDWGQGKPEVLNAIYAKIIAATTKDDSWFSKLLSTKPKIETVSEYLPHDSPAVADNGKDEDPHVSVGQAALDAAQSPAEMAGLVGHEVWHTRRQDWKRDCLNRGFHKAREGNSYLLAKGFMGRPEVTDFQKDLEHEADSHGQKIAADAGYDPLALVAMLNHIKDLGEALGADASADTDHDSFEQREAWLRAYNPGAKPYDAKCPWGD